MSFKLEVLFQLHVSCLQPNRCSNWNIDMPKIPTLWKFSKFCLFQGNQKVLTDLYNGYFQLVINN